VIAAVRAAAAAAESTAHAARDFALTFGTAADSAAYLVRLEHLHEYRKFVEGWHEFYLMTGTAAVTLAGLLFVALSLHLEVLVQERFASLLVVARSTLSTFVVLLVVSLMLLAPDPTPRTTGITLVVFAGIFMVLTIREMRGAFRQEHAEFSRRLLRRRLLFPVFGYAIIVIIGAFVIRGIYEMLFLMVSVASGLLANAVWASWDLLVRVARTKERMKSEASGAGGS